METQAAENAPARVLMACQQVETACAELYGDIAELCRSDREAADFFRKMAREEEEHRAQFEFLYKILNVTEVGVNVDLKVVAGALEAIEKIAGQVKGIESCRLKDILSVAIRIEERLASLHADVVAQVEDPQWQSLFQGLVRADVNHAEGFRGFRRRRFGE